MQPPQWLVLVLTLTSQPSVCLLLLQSPKPMAQAPLHTPGAEQVRIGTFRVEQATAQPPQFVGSVKRLVSQPSVSLLLLQSAKPTLQPPLQTPLAQVGLGAVWIVLNLGDIPQYGDTREYVLLARTLQVDSYRPEFMIQERPRGIAYPALIAAVDELPGGGGLVSEPGTSGVRGGAYWIEGLQLLASLGSLIYFLRKGLPEKHPWRSVLPTYFDALVASKDAGQALDAAWKGVDLAAFEQAWAAFIMKDTLAPMPKN